MTEHVISLVGADFEYLVPFHAHWGADGALQSMSNSLRKFWHYPADEQLDGLLLVRPFNAPLESKWFGEISGMVLSVTHVCCTCREHTLRGELTELQDGGWLLVGRPDVSRVIDLENLGLALSDLPLHIGLGDLLIANEAAQVSLKESSKINQRLQETNREITEINDAFSRFVPGPYLETLGLNSPTEAQLGAHVGVYKNVMFADLRNFTRLSEQLSSKEIFNFINAYLGNIAPAIREHGGFVLHYLGDGIMALFPEEPTQAILAAIAMQSRIREWRSDQKMPSNFVLSLGIGLHYGHLALGLVGEGERWDSSVISDAVNTASRVEGLTKTFGADLLITETTRDGLSDPDQFAMRRIGRIGVKGKAEQVVVYEVMDSLSDEARASRDRIAVPFKEGVEAFERDDLTEAKVRFAACMVLSPEDLTTRYYCQLLNGIPQSYQRRETKTLIP
ncbi:MAG: adenylate/guanylate cyclase domain-containing protein [Myxococcota bacterium]